MLVSGYWIVNGSYPYFIPAKADILSSQFICHV
jgi:hypothetical protein